MRYDFEVGLRRCRIWLGEYPDARFEPQGVLDAQVSPSSQMAAARRDLAIELAYPETPSSYALIGASFVPSESEAFNVEIGTNDATDRILDDTVAYRPDTVFVGLPDDLARAIIKQICYCAAQADFAIPSGRLSICAGAHAYVGSSQVSFMRGTHLLLWLLSHYREGMLENEVREMAVEALGTFKWPKE